MLSVDVIGDFAYFDITHSVSAILNCVNDVINTKSCVTLIRIKCITFNLKSYRLVIRKPEFFNLHLK
jgi:hypothetical protein